jgi:hypothetical protein
MAPQGCRSARPHPKHQPVIRSANEHQIDHPATGITEKSLTASAGEQIAYLRSCEVLDKGDGISTSDQQLFVATKISPAETRFGRWMRI